MTTRLFDLLFERSKPVEGLPFGCGTTDDYKENQSAICIKAVELLKETVIDMGDQTATPPRYPRINVEAVRKMVEEGYLLAPEEKGQKTWTTDGLRTNRAHDESGLARPPSR
jgi:hypothetical protein